MLYSTEACVQLAHALGAITFVVHISPHVSKAEPRPDHPTHITKFAYSNSLACYYPVLILYMHLLLILFIGKLFVMSFLMSLSRPQGYYLKET